MVNIKNNNFIVILVFFNFECEDMFLIIQYRVFLIYIFLYSKILQFILFEFFFGQMIFDFFQFCIEVFFYFCQESFVVCVVFIIGFYNLIKNIISELFYEIKLI